MQASSPAISTNVKSVMVGPTLTSKANIESFTFSNTSKGYDNNTAAVIKCTMTVAGIGSLTGACVAYAPDGTHNAHISGTLALTTACDLSGTLTVQGDPTPVTIRGAHVNGNFAAGIATQGAEFHHFTLVKQ